MSKNAILYPPISVFPRTPDLSSWVQPKRITEVYKVDADTMESRAGQITSSKLNSLDFVLGVGGRRNIIKTYSAPYVDYSKYNEFTNVWAEKPIILTIAGNTNVEDLTDYSKKKMLVFSGNAAGINDKIEYFFDGEKIITNADFTNPDDRTKVTVTYTKLIDTIRVKGVVVNLSPKMNTRTPVIDQYTLLIGKQRTLD